MTVVDGDLGARVDGAEVRVGRETGASGPRGLARVPLRRKAPLPVEIAAPGYVTKRIRLDFSERRRYTIRIYQERLQWPIYGATPERTQAQLDIELRPPSGRSGAVGSGRSSSFRPSCGRELPTSTRSVGC